MCLDGTQKSFIMYLFTALLHSASYQKINLFQIYIVAKFDECIKDVMTETLN